MNASPDRDSREMRLPAGRPYHGGLAPDCRPALARQGASQYRCPIDTDKEPSAAKGDPAADWWTMDDIAAYLTSCSPREVKVPSVRRYRARPLERGGLPPNERKFGNSPVWRPQTIIHWNVHERRGHGWRAGLTGHAGNARTS